ncbi:PREDICTED: bifunctional epoxide hydrolase 2-like [Tarenaya hassleriana]|uniref:bifunctional epoxide hydrolase 2-like n=1 Tax=Tarenaya hassleriana TaxID=28532 RepID=UPI00053C1493|nr:PREDICTED: bifunctional epoxide hydrolase 2-like [Tarenaya hassleriana]
MELKGYRAVAPDLRGYGDSFAPTDIPSYTGLHMIGDLAAVISAVTTSEDEKVFVVGHAWGALMAWYLCLLRPDKVKALVNLSVPFSFVPKDPWPEVTPIEQLRRIYGDDLYVVRFQEPGDIEAEIAEVGTERVMKRFFTYRTPYPFIIPKDKSFWGRPDIPIPLPSWLSEEEVQYYVRKFEETGFSGAVNSYRNFARNDELISPCIGIKVAVPTKFIIGDLDHVYHMPGIKEYIHGPQFKEDVPLLDPPVVMLGVAHWINQEKPDEILHHIYDFIRKF